jgi:hypothetical protein
MAKNCILSDGIDIENCILSGYTIAYRGRRENTKAVTVEQYRLPYFVFFM